jgi:hypothetical protein
MELHALFHRGRTQIPCFVTLPNKASNNIARFVAYFLLFVMKNREVIGTLSPQRQGGREVGSCEALKMIYRGLRFHCPSAHKTERLYNQSIPILETNNSPRLLISLIAESVGVYVV